MRDTNKALDLLVQPTSVAASPWKVGPVTTLGTPARRTWVGRILRKRETTTYQRCLAVHIHFAGPHSALS
jgi:hypothetical protein